MHDAAAPACMPFHSRHWHTPRRQQRGHIAVHVRGGCQHGRVETGTDHATVPRQRRDAPVRVRSSMYTVAAPARELVSRVGGEVDIGGTCQISASREGGYSLRGRRICPRYKSGIASTPPFPREVHPRLRFDGRERG
ncbi:hypothetical protein VTO73DRAFT_8028 [Trametes versicolor]